MSPKRQSNAMGTAEAIARELGTLSEASHTATKRAAEDREAVNNGFKAINDTLDDIRGQIRNLSQTSDATSKVVQQIALEKAGMRLDKIEACVFEKEKPDICERISYLENRAARRDKWMGTGWAFFGKATLVLIGSSAAWGWLATNFQHLAEHFHF